MKNFNMVILYILFISMLSARPAAAQRSNIVNANEAPAAQPQNPPSASPFKDDKEKVSYALGMRLSLEVKRLQSMKAEIDPNMLAQGLKDSLSGKTLLTEDERNLALAQLQQGIIFKQKQERQQEAEANQKEGEAFLAANKTKEGVVTLPSGLQYKILRQGSGPKPHVNNSVLCNYRGTLINGKEFDSSEKQGQPVIFEVFGVIPGWTEALQLMPVGSKWQLFIPSSLAYGERGHGTDVGPNATLIFEVELLSIQEKENEKTPAKPR